MGDGPDPRLLLPATMRGFLIALCLVSATSATIFQDCGSLAQNVVFTLTDCEAPPCVLQRGTTYDVNFKFTASGATSELKVAATANIGGINLPWPGINTDACLWLVGTGNECPIEAGEDVDWTMQAPVLNEYPKISSVAMFKLVDEAGGFQTCAAVPFTIV